MIRTEMTIAWNNQKCLTAPNLDYTRGNTDAVVIFSESRSTMYNSSSTIIRDIIIWDHPKCCLRKLQEVIKQWNISARTRFSKVQYTVKLQIKKWKKKYIFYLQKKMAEIGKLEEKYHESTKQRSTLKLLILEEKTRFLMCVHSWYSQKLMEMNKTQMT